MKSRILIVFGSTLARDQSRYHQTFEGGNCIRRTLDLAEFPTFTIHFGLIHQQYVGVRFDCIIEDDSVGRAEGKDRTLWESRKLILLIPKKHSSPPRG